MSFFRKLGESIAPMFRKLPEKVATFGQKLSHGVEKIDRGMLKASDFMDKIDHVVPNPFTKVARDALRGVSGVSGGLAKGAEALGALSRGDLKSAYSLGKQGLSEAKSGVGSSFKTLEESAPLFI